jgi:hypothetical protein
LIYYKARLGEDTLGLIREASPRGQASFLYQANCATVYLALAGSAPSPVQREYLGYARVYLKSALRQWPRAWPGWTRQQLTWFKEVEQLLFKLLEVRYKEANRAGQVRTRRTEPFDQVDDLFGVRFVGEKGRYAAGQLAPREKAKLKGNEVQLLQQLLTWLPRDYRLYWLYGELLNAGGNQKDTRTAAIVLENCVRIGQLTGIPVLREHRNILKEALARTRSGSDPYSLLKKPSPPTRPGVPGAEQPAEDAGWMPSIGQWVLVGGVGAVLLGLIGYFQIREIRRRRNVAG